MKKVSVMRGDIMDFKCTKKLLYLISIVCFFYVNAALAEDSLNISTRVEKNICSIVIDGVVADYFKCEYSHAASFLSYSNLYALDKKILVFIERPMGNACDGGPLHILSKTEDKEYKPLKVIDFCGGHYPLITSGPEKFTIYIPSIEIDGTTKNIPAETWELKGGALVKNRG
ncbi:UNVERIFIED_ORG: hypothetical protein M2414_005384 [Rahnella aquatilis]